MTTVSRPLRPNGFGRASLLVGAAALLVAALAAACAALGVGERWITFDGLVYTFLGMGAVGCVGLVLALIALFRPGGRSWTTMIALALNLTLAVVGSAFVVLLPA